MPRRPSRCHVLASTPRMLSRACGESAALPLLLLLLDAATVAAPEAAAEASPPAATPKLPLPAACMAAPPPTAPAAAAAIARIALPLGPRVMAADVPPSVWKASRVRTRSRGYVMSTAVAPALLPASRSTTGGTLAWLAPATPASTSTRR